MKRFCAVLCFLAAAWVRAAAPVDVMPLPADAKRGEGRFPIAATWTVAIRGVDDAALREAVARARQRWQERTGLTFAADAPAEAPVLAIECVAAAPAIPQLGDDESYTLEVSPERATLRAPTTLGARRGLETWLQLLATDGTGWFVPAVTIRDRPRFAWRGLLIDPARHWLPVETVKRILDAMAVVKLNVLHFHLTDDQGFRIESKTFPRLHELGSGGLYYTQEQIRDLIAYAAARGIRIVPEFDVPGHATSWCAAFPELASAPGPYEVDRRWGVHNPVLDPTNEKTYALLDGFFGEMAALFPDAFMHIGGDENNGRQWNANPRIQAFVREHHLENNAGLHAYFNRRVTEILQKNGKRLVGWDEILHPDLPASSVVHSWRGAASLGDAARRGFSAILSNGYYLDHADSARRHYAVDPVPADTTLTADEQKRILGGEACMWGEWVSAETIESRIWPRAAAVAERLWSPRETNDVSDLYRRLALVSARLEEAGARHRTAPAAMLRRFAGDACTADDLGQLRAFATAFEAGALGVRSRAAHGTITQDSPLTGFADCLPLESDMAREFAAAVERFVFAPGPRNQGSATALSDQLDTWREAGDEIVATLAAKSPRIAQLAPVADGLVQATESGLQALLALSDGTILDRGWETAQFDVIARAAQPNAIGITFPLAPALRLLVAAAVCEPQREKMSAADWRALVEKMAAPPRPARRNAKP